MPKYVFNKTAKWMDGCSPVNLLHILRTPLPMNTSGGLLPKIFGSEYKNKENLYRKPQHYL